MEEWAKVNSFLKANYSGNVIAYVGLVRQIQVELVQPLVVYSLVSCIF